MDGFRLNRRRFTVAAASIALGACGVHAQDPAVPVPDIPFDEVALMNLLTKTGGGRQFWSDVWFYHQWHIQRNVFTGHYRLLDGADHRFAFGTFAECRQAFDKIREGDDLKPMTGRAVVVLHGLFSARALMRSLCTSLEASGDFTVFNVGYPTTRGSVAQHAAGLDEVLRSLDGVTEINFVGHSLGNLVIRCWLCDVLAGRRTIPQGQRLGRMVMLAPPNHHPQIATSLIRGELALSVAGAAARELATGWEALAPCLATPPMEFGILAGGTGNKRGFNPLLPGDNDAVITVESTRLPGACDFRLLPLLHSFIIFDARTKQLTANFLKNGCFESEAARQPV
jgi:pimeloyl-ACP methyl ester carboxylesterase